MRALRLTPSEIEFYKPLVASYLKYGSVDKVFADFAHDTGVSYPHFHRILKQWGIVKSAGPQSRFAEAVYFLTALAKDNLPLETLYKTMPASLQISAVTLHRILSYVKRGLTRRSGTALIVSPESDPSMALIGRDISSPRPELGKPFGSYSLPMTYSKRVESVHDSILRVLQQEVAASLSVARNLPPLIPNDPRVLVTIDIADVRVKTYQIIIPDGLLKKLDSYKLADLSFVPLAEIAANVGLESSYRAGVPEIAAGILTPPSPDFDLPLHLGSVLNQKLALLPAYTQ
ncbi:MAG: hypothetical protein WAV56_03560 [Microgenomates group bacterium]